MPAPLDPPQHACTLDTPPSSALPGPLVMLDGVHLSMGANPRCLQDDDRDSTSDQRPSDQSEAGELISPRPPTSFPPPDMPRPSSYAAAPRTAGGPDQRQGSMLTSQLGPSLATRPSPPASAPVAAPQYQEGVPKGYRKAADPVLDDRSLDAVLNGAAQERHAHEPEAGTFVIPPLIADLLDAADAAEDAARGEKNPSADESGTSRSAHTVSPVVCAHACACVAC